MTASWQCMMQWHFWTGMRAGRGGRDRGGASSLLSTDVAQIVYTIGIPATNTMYLPEMYLPRAILCTLCSTICLMHTLQHL
jgi:hypothetical protein